MAETVVALVLGWLLLYLALSTFARQRTLQVDMTRRTETLATIRAIRHVLDGEVREGDPTRDGGAVAPDSIGLRAFRGMALICPPEASTTQLLVSARGTRLPDPSKDSVLIIRADGSTTTAALTSRVRSTGDCGGVGPSPWERWTLSVEVPPGIVLARYFERGSYHLAGQPLTPAVLDGARSVFNPIPGGVEIEVVPALVEGEGSWWPTLGFRPPVEGG